jgi:hypothetical protein
MQQGGSQDRRGLDQIGNSHRLPERMQLRYHGRAANYLVVIPAQIGWLPASGSPPAWTPSSRDCVGVGQAPAGGSNTGNWLLVFYDQDSVKSGAGLSPRRPRAVQGTGRVPVQGLVVMTARSGSIVPRIRPGPALTVQAGDLPATPIGRSRLSTRWRRSALDGRPTQR